MRMHSREWLLRRVCDCRWKSAKVEAFGRFEEGEVVAEDEDGEIRCPFPEGALLVMPTQLPVEGEEAWLWGLPL